MEAYEPFASIGIALAAGLLVGLEREQSQDTETKPGTTFLGGARTYPLFAMFGALAMMLGRSMPWLPVLALLGVMALVGVSYIDDVRRERDRGMTSEVSSLVTFMIGALATSHGLVEPLGRRVILVASLAVIVTFLLSAKPMVRSVLERVSRDDLFATVKFLIVAVIVLPLLPNQAVGPFDAINPFNVGLMVVLIAGMSFVGYVASRWLGARRGILAAAMVGGLASSTAVTLSFSGRARREPGLARLSAAAIVLASTIMVVRILVEVAVVYRPLVRPLAIPLGAMAVAGVAVALLFFRGQRAAAEKSGDAVSFTNPFELSSAVRFALLFAAVALLAKAAQVYAGAHGMYVAALLAGTTDVDAITLSAAGLAKTGLEPRVAVLGILLGAASNTAVKTGMALFIGGWRLGRLVLLAMAIVLAAGAAAAAVSWAVAG